MTTDSLHARNYAEGATCILEFGLPSMYLQSNHARRKIDGFKDL